MKQNQVITKGLVVDQSKPILGEQKVCFLVDWIDCITKEK